MRRKEDRTSQILALLVQEKKIEVLPGHGPQGSGRHGGAGPDHQRARLRRPVQHG